MDLNLSLRKQDINMPRQILAMLEPISLPRYILIPSKMQTPAQLDIQGTTGKYTGGKAPKAQLDTSTETGNGDEVFKPEIHIPTDADFVIPPSLDKAADPMQIVHTFLPKQGEIECLLKKINRKCWLLKQSKITLKLSDKLLQPPYCGHFIRS